MFVKKFISFSKTLLMLFIIVVTVVLLTGVMLEKVYAGNYVQSPINMIKLLDYVIQSQRNFDVNNMHISSPMKGKTLKVLADSYNLSRLNIYVPVIAKYPEITTDTITFVACNESDICFNNGQWIGNVFSDTVLIPGESHINLRSYITGSVFAQDLFIYGLINAQNVQTEPTIVFSYTDTNNLSETIQVRLEEVSADVDTDGNGLPDDVKNVLLSGEFWSANRWINNALRNVYIQNIDVPGDTTKVIPLNLVEIEFPTLEKLKKEAVIPMQTNFAYLMIVVSDDISAQVDIVTQNPGEKDLSTWINDAMSKAPGNVNQEIGFIGIHLFYIDEQGQSHVLSLPESFPIEVNIRGLSKPNWVQIKPYSFPSTVVENYLTNDTEKEDNWIEIPSITNSQGMTLNVQGNGIIALYNLGINITSITPNQIPQGIETPLTLQGIIPVNTVKSISQASELYEVLIGGKTAFFRDGSTNQSDIAITAYNGSNENKMFITAPAISDSGSVDLEIIDKTVNGLSFLFPDAITILDVFRITAGIERGPDTQSQEAEVIINPVKNSALPEDGMFFDGDMVTLSVQNIDEGDQFDGWYSADGTLFSRLTELIIRVHENLNLKARIQRRQYSLSVAVEPSDTGTVILNPSGESFAPGTEVELTAEPIPGFKFTKWLLSKNKTSTDNPLKLTIDENYSVTAVFETGPPEFSGIARLANGNFEIDNLGKERLVVWAFGGLVWRINGYNLEETTTLQLVDARTGKDIGSPFTGINIADDGTYIDFIIPPYPLYSDTMPSFVDVDIKTGTSIVPAFRYYHYLKDTFNIYSTAFITDLSKAENISVFIDGTAQGSIQFPGIGESGL
ncbi:MAG: InlB B-repeat-containing protein, partial [Candidatus Hydrogenedens sp.]